MKHNNEPKPADDNTDEPAPVVEKAEEPSAATDPDSKAVTSVEPDAPAASTESTDNGQKATADESNVETSVASTVSSPAHAETQLGGWSWLIRFGVKSAGVVAVGALLLFLIGIAQRTEWVTADGFSGSSGDEAAESGGGGEDKRYICPMMCTPPSTEPGRCPVCAMELVEATSGGGGDGISVTIEASARRLVGIQTAMSKMGQVTRTIRTIGSIDFDESRLSTISAYIDGRLEKMYADYAGVKVSEGDDLAMIYSPQLYSAQTEFVTSLEGSSSKRFQIGDSNLQDMARENLSELGMTKEQIASLRTEPKTAITHSHQISSKRNRDRKDGCRRRLCQDRPEALSHRRPDFCLVDA